MIIELAAYSGVAALLELDNVSVGQFMLARPSVAGAILGFATGDFINGVQTGLWMELLFLDQMPVGGFIPPSGLVGAAGAVLVRKSFGLAPAQSFVIGIVLAYLYSKVERQMRTWRSGWNAGIEKQLAELRPAMGRWVLKAVVTQFSACAFFIFAGAFLLGYAGRFLCGACPGRVMTAVNFAYMMVPCIGLVTLILTLRPKR